MAPAEAETSQAAWLRVPAEDEVPAEVKELWEKPLERLGFVPNVLRVFALRPGHLLRWWSGIGCRVTPRGASVNAPKVAA